MENGNEKIGTGTGPSEAHRELFELIDIIHQMNLADIYRTFWLNAKEYTCVSAVHEAFSKIVHILRNKKVTADTKSLNESLAPIWPKQIKVAY